MQTNNDELALLVIWILTTAVNLAVIAAAVAMAIRSKQFSDMDFPRYLPLGPKTLERQKKIGENKICSE